MTTITRRRALAMLAGTAPLRAGQAVPGIVEPLPPEWFVPQGTNAETRFEALASPLALTYDDLRALPAHTTSAVIECAGNGRRFFAERCRSTSSATSTGPSCAIP